ncbi:hypothetical protein FQR65_LT08093 [Abscondita terminalis]|nr:hypothetical protein FQR65_LT08093 [Abscondita terminalis]
MDQKFETEPLLVSQHRLYSSDCSDRDVEKTTTKSLSYSERITFTWSEINVFTIENARVANRFCQRGLHANYFAPQGKQILKNGTFFPIRNACDMEM